LKAIETDDDDDDEIEKCSSVSRNLAWWWI